MLDGVSSIKIRVMFHKDVGFSVSGRVTLARDSSRGGLMESDQTAKM